MLVPLFALTVSGLRAILRPMRALSVITLLAALLSPLVAFAEIQTFIATHTYVLGDHDSKDDARQRCLLETKRTILEQAGVYIESESEVRNFDLTKDKITSFTAAVMQVKDTKEEVSFQQGHMTMTLKLTAQVDLEEVRKQLAERHVDASVRDDVAMQKERLKRLETQLEEMRQQIGKATGQTPAPPPNNIAAAELQTLTAQAIQGNAEAQGRLGWLYAFGEGVPQDYLLARQWWERAAAQGDVMAQSALGELYADGLGGAQDYTRARKWWEKAAAQGSPLAQTNLGTLYVAGRGVPQDFVQARQWYEKAAAQGFAMAMNKLGVLYANGEGVPQDYKKARQWYEQAAAQGSAQAQSNLGYLYVNGKSVPHDDVRAYMWYSLAAGHESSDYTTQWAVSSRDKVARRMTPAQIAEAQRLAQQCQAQGLKGC